MTDRVVLMGCKGGPAIRTGSMMPTSSLLEIGAARVVVDCGLGVTRGLADAGMRLADLTHIVVTHLHSDHYLELGPLLHTAWTAGLKTPVQVIGPSGLPAYWRGFLDSMRYDIDLRIADEGRPDLGGLATFSVLQEGAAHDVAGLRLTALRNEHPPVAESFALRFDGAGRAVVFSGDTAHFPPLADFARGADLLVHEAMLTPAVDALVARVGNGDDRLKIHLLRSHTSAEDAARIAAQAGVAALAFHHMIPADDPNFGPEDWRAAIAPFWTGRFYLGHDGLTIPLELNHETRNPT